MSNETHVYLMFVNYADNEDEEFNTGLLTPEAFKTLEAAKEHAFYGMLLPEFGEPAVEWIPQHEDDDDDDEYQIYRCPQRIDEGRAYLEIHAVKYEG